MPFIIPWGNGYWEDVCGYQAQWDLACVVEAERVEAGAVDQPGLEVDKVPWQ